jgi:predicted NAD/FAD-dependent oxidoreductase
MGAEVRIVGAGLAGLACARAVAGAGHNVVVYEQEEQVGGRMAARWLGGRPVDLGASYLTCREEEFKTVVDDWVRRKLAHPWTTAFAVDTALGRSQSEDGPVRYGAPNGLRSLVEDLAIGVNVALGQRIGQIGPGPTVDGRKVDAVVLAMPDEPAHQVLDPACESERAATDTASWTPVLALAAAWPERLWDVDGVFVHDDPILTWIADDGRRRADLAPVLVAHSTGEFAAEYLNDPDLAIGPMLDAVSSVLSVDSTPSWTFMQPWRYARPTEPKAAPFHLGDANIGICGDAWGSPRVENAWLSGHRLGLELARRLE